MEVRRSEVYWVDFGEIRGKEMAGEHPAVVISINRLNDLHFPIVVVAGTSASNVGGGYPTDVRVSSGESFHPEGVLISGAGGLGRVSRRPGCPADGGSKMNPGQNMIRPNKLRGNSLRLAHGGCLVLLSLTKRGNHEIDAFGTRSASGWVEIG